MHPTRTIVRSLFPLLSLVAVGATFGCSGAESAGGATDDLPSSTPVPGGDTGSTGSTGSSGSGSLGDPTGSNAPDAAAQDAGVKDTGTIDAGASILYGSSTGGNTPSTIALVAPRIVRVYEGGSPTALGGQALTVPAGTPMHYSCKPDMVALGAHDSTLVAQLKTVIAAIPQIAGARVTIHHEFDNDGGGATAAVYQAGWSAFLSDVVAPVNATRTIKLITVPITTPGPYVAGTMDSWYIAGADEIGTDAYSSNAVHLAQAYAKSKGKPWSLPEYGYSVSVDGTDVEVLARMHADESFWTAAANPPSAVIWFNANHNVLSTRPLAASYWKAISAP